MMRTSLTLPPALYQRVMLTAKVEQKNMGEMIRELLNAALVQKERSQIDESYQALGKMVGICKDDVTDTASSIDEILYGEHGAWKGTDE